MPITIVPPRGRLFICHFGLGSPVPPEMRKSRRAVVVSPRSYNRRHGHGPGRCLVVPLSASEPRFVTLAHVPFPAGVYASLTVPTWAACDVVTSVSHDRLDRVAVAGALIDESLTATDLARLDAGLRHALGLVQCS